jgi:hypothetical protein
MKLSIILAVAGISIAVGSQALAQERTCTSMMEGCKRVAPTYRGDPKLCQVQWTHCKNTGHWWGPFTNGNYGDVVKK